MPNTTPTIPPRVTIQDIPPEITLQILDQLRGIRTESQSPLSVCRLTCKYLSRLAQSLLFDIVTLGYDCQQYLRPAERFEQSRNRLSQFFDLLIRNPTIAMDVHELYLIGYQAAKTGNDGWYTAHARDSDSSLITADGATDDAKYRQFWHNDELAQVFDRLSSLRRFSLCVQSYPAFKWEEVGKNVWIATLRLLIRPSITHVEFLNVVNMPVNIIACSPNLECLNVTANEMDYYAGSVKFKEAEGSSTAPGPLADGGLKLKDLRVVGCNSLFELNPTVQDRLSWDGCDPKDLNAVLLRSKDTLSDLTVHFECGNNDIYSSALNPPLAQYPSLKRLTAQIEDHFTHSFIVNLTALLVSQFSTHGGAPGVTYFRISARWLQNMDLSSALSSHPKAWYALDRAIPLAFPHLDTLVVRMGSIAVGEGHLAPAKLFVKRVLPTMTEAKKVRVFLEVDGWEEVDLTDYHVNIPLFASDVYATHIRDYGTW